MRILLLIELLTALRKDPKPRMLEDHEVPANGPHSFKTPRPPVPALQAELEPEENEFTTVWTAS